MNNPHSPASPAISAALATARLTKAHGGFTIREINLPPKTRKAMKFRKPILAARHVAASPKVHSGPIPSHVAGRTDHLPMHVRSGSYVVPADVVSGLGEGNTLAGFRVAKSIFGQPFYGTAKAGAGAPYGQGATPYGQPLPRKDGGEVGAVPIVAAGGEHVITPEDVIHIGGGDIDMGHKILDEFVKRMRARIVKTMQNLPGPRTD